MSEIPQWTIRTGPGQPPWAIQFRRTADNRAPEGLMPGQPAVEMKSPYPKLWIGVPSFIDPTERVPVVGSDVYLPLIGGTLSNNREDTHINPILIIDHPTDPTIGFSENEELWWIVAGRRNEYSIRYAIEPNNGFTLNPNGDGWFDRHLACNGDFTTNSNIYLNGTSDPWAWILRSNEPGYRNLRVAAVSDTPLDNFSINALNTWTTGNLIVSGALTVEQGVSVNGGDLWVRNRIITNGGIDVWGGQLFVNNALIAYTEGEGGVEVYHRLQVFGYATVNDGQSLGNWYVPDGWIYGREVRTELLTAGEAYVHNTVSAHNILARNDLTVNGVAFLRGGRPGISGSYPSMPYGLVVDQASQFQGMVDVISSAELIRQNPIRANDSVRLAPEQLYAQVWVACSAAEGTFYGPPGARVSYNIPGGGQWFTGAETNGTFTLIKQDILANAPRDVVLWATSGHVQIEGNLRVTGVIFDYVQEAPIGVPYARQNNTWVPLPDFSQFATYGWVQSQGYATQAWVLSLLGAQGTVTWRYEPSGVNASGSYPYDAMVIATYQGTDVAGVSALNETLLGIMPSDERLKNNIIPATRDALSVLTKIPMFEFDIVSPTVGTEHYNIGFTAQKLEPFIPEAIRSTFGNWLGIDVGVVTSYNTRAIQQLAEENTALKQRIAALEERR